MPLIMFAQFLNPIAILCITQTIQAVSQAGKDVPIGRLNSLGSGKLAQFPRRHNGSKHFFLSPSVINIVLHI